MLRPFLKHTPSPSSLTASTPRRLCPVLPSPFRSFICSKSHNNHIHQIRMSASAAAAAGSSNNKAVADDSEHAQLPTQGLKLELLPLKYTKVLHLIRHGEGFHNVAGRINHDNYKSFDYEDAHLTSIGWQQAERLHEHIRSTKVQVDLVVVSPLTRALETAVGAFGTPVPSSNNGSGHSSPQSLLMVEQRAVEGKVTAHAAVSGADAPPFIAHELCREHIGVHPCDRRRSLSHYKQNFPAVDFSLVETDEDVWWTRDTRESKEAIRTRGLAFLQWVMSRPERNIAVVTHSSFLHFTLGAFGAGASTTVQGDLHKWYENCEMRSLVLSDAGAAAAASPDVTHFPGGDLVVPGASTAATGHHSHKSAGEEQTEKEADKEAAPASESTCIVA